MTTVTIVLNEDGSIGVKADGPASDNKATLVGLLELAKAAIVQAGARPKPPTPPLLVAQGALPRNGFSR